MSLKLVHVSNSADALHRWPDGCLLGLKLLKWESYDGEYVVMSPHRLTVWNGTRLTADNIPEARLRNEEGIHAIWPPREKEGAQDDEIAVYSPKKSKQFWAAVAGWGRCVTGDVGWRAEHVEIRRAITIPKHASAKFLIWCQKHGVEVVK